MRIRKDGRGRDVLLPISEKRLREWARWEEDEDLCGFEGPVHFCAGRLPVPALALQKTARSEVYDYLDEVPDEGLLLVSDAMLTSFDSVFAVGRLNKHTACVFDSCLVALKWPHPETEEILFAAQISSCKKRQKKDYD